MASNIAGMVQALINTIGSDSAYSGISPAPLPDDAFADSNNPWITVQELNAKELQTLDGGSGVGPCFIQFNVWSKDYEAAYELRLALNAIIAVMTGTIYADIGHRDVVVQGGNFMGNYELIDGERKLHQLISRFQMWIEV